MSFLKSVAEEEANGDVADLYRREIERVGYLPNYSQTFSLHPQAYRAWRDLIASIAKAMDERRYELATLAAAARLRSSACALAHGSILEEKFFEPDEVAQIARGKGPSVLDPTEALVVEFAAKVVGDATEVTEDDIHRLRAAGLSDRDILDVVLAAAARSFFSKVLDATGTLADAVYGEMDTDLREALTIGRPIADG